MALKIGDKKDFCAGIMFIVMGAFFACGRKITRWGRQSAWVRLISRPFWAGFWSRWG